MNLNASEIFGDKELNFTLYPHQASAAWWMKTIMFNAVNRTVMKGGILADVMGLGKTNETCAVIAATRVPKTLVLTPSSTRYNWIETLLKYVKSDVTICTIEKDTLYRCTFRRDTEGNNHIRKEKMFKRNDNIAIFGDFVMVANYELTATTDSTNVKMITDHEFNNLFIDEGHFLRNVNQSWENINRVVRHPYYIGTDGYRQRAGCRFIITGTPIQMDPKDIVNIFKFIDKEYCDNHSTGGLIRYLIDNYLFRRSVQHLSPFMKRFMKFPETEPVYENLIVDIPDTDLSRNIAMTDYRNLHLIFSQNRQFVDQLETDEKAFLTLLLTELKYENEVNKKNGFTETQEMRTMMSFPYTSKPILLSSIKPDFKYRGRASKIDKIRNILNKYNTSIVIFHHYMKIAEILNASLTKTHGNDYTIISINGEIDDEQRYINLKLADRLIASGRKVILLSSTGATSEGVNYQSFNILVKIDREYNPKTEDQTEGRIQRIGQDKQVYIINIHMNGIRTYYGDVEVDNHIESIRNSKEQLSNCIDTYNCAFKFRRYYVSDESLGVDHESGTNFGDTFEHDYRGQPGGPDSYGPEFIH